MSSNAQLDLSDTDSTDSTSSSPTSKIEVALSIHPHPENIANIKSLLAIYRNRIDILTYHIPAQEEKFRLLLGAAVWHQHPDEAFKARVRHDINLREKIRNRWLATISADRDKKAKLEDVLRFVDQPNVFRAKMAAVKHRMQSG
jgi:hypothetical protein